MRDCVAAQLQFFSPFVVPCDIENLEKYFSSCHNCLLSSVRFVCIKALGFEWFFSYYYLYYLLILAFSGCLRMWMLAG